jgi:hypothetical protein
MSRCEFLIHKNQITNLFRSKGQWTDKLFMPRQNYKVRPNVESVLVKIAGRSISSPIMGLSCYTDRKLHMDHELMS